MNAKLTTVSRGHAFARAGKGRATSFADKRRIKRTTAKVRFRFDNNK